ncbi:hypothetical protein PHET_08035 [Paragonimus heterotremus]|uniref:Uncharacterized protein n=1 Tax=Paragonimus heterotremus TaxID=100268 RepID=A0A8J4T715_9TREM|nr:hypothetical protein PHET_08035 [Paragonimus heterotremus]
MGIYKAVSFIYQWRIRVTDIQKCLTSVPEPTKWLLNGAEIEEDPSPYVIQRPFPSKSCSYEEIELLKKNDLESLIHHANETEGRLHQLHKQYEDLAARYDETKCENHSVRLEMEQYKQETTTLRKQMIRLTGEQTDRKQNLKEWMYRTEKSEESLIDLRRTKEKLSRQKTDCEQQIGQLRAQLDKKQKHAQTMLDELILTQGQLDISEKESIDLKSNLSRNEQRVKELSQELLITKDRLEKTQQLLGEAELIRSAAEHKIEQQNTE